MARILQVQSGKSNISAGHLLLGPNDKVIVTDREFARMPATFATNLIDLGPGMLYSPPVNLTSITADAQVLAIIVPGFRGQVLSAFAMVTAAATTAAKLANIGVYIDPVASGEVQTLSATGATAGALQTLSFGGQVTAPISWNSTAAQVQAALVALSNVEPGDVTCTGGPLNTTPIVITFAPSDGDVPMIAVGGTPFTTTPATITLTTAGGTDTGSVSGVPVIGGRIALTSANATPIGKIVAASRIPGNPRLGPSSFGKSAALSFRVMGAPTAFVEGAVIFGVEVGPAIKGGPISY